MRRSMASGRPLPLGESRPLRRRTRGRSRPSRGRAPSRGAPQPPRAQGQGPAGVSPAALMPAVAAVTP